MPFGGVIVNKVHYESELPDHDPEQLRERAHRRRSTTRTSPHGSSPTTRTTGRSPRATGSNIKRLTAEMRARLVIQVPYLDTDVHDLAGLMRINDYLFAAGARERTEIAAEA